MNMKQFYQWRSEFEKTASSQASCVRKPLIMGVLNITPDSFSDGGSFLNPNRAYERAQEMIAEGVDIIDIGGESARPGSHPISVQMELDRVLPVIERIRAGSDICLSIDTYKAEVMESAVALGASFINDIYALQGEGALAVAAKWQVPVCLMHMQGKPKTMQENPHYPQGVLQAINDFFAQRLDVCLQAGIFYENIILDPGIGFGKTVSHNLQILRHLPRFQQRGLPVLLGVSHKSVIGAVLQKEVHERLSGGIAIAVFAALQGVSMIRTHDVAETYQALQMIDAITTDKEQCVV